MSLQYQRQKPHDFYIPEICWRCDTPMKVKTIMPAMTFPLLDEIVYRCPACYLERRQTVRSSSTLGGLGLLAGLATDAGPCRDLYGQHSVD
jgi:hypothetical protein